MMYSWKDIEKNRQQKTQKKNPHNMRAQASQEYLFPPCFYSPLQEATAIVEPPQKVVVFKNSNNRVELSVHEPAHQHAVAKALQCSCVVQRGLQA